MIGLRAGAEAGTFAVDARAARLGPFAFLENQDAGAFGENVTTEGIDLDALLLGSRLRVGEDVELEVRVPREPCSTFAVTPAGTGMG